MNIRQRSSHELQGQVSSFLDDVVKRGKMKEENRDKILQLFQSGGNDFINWLNLKLGKTVNISDEKQIKKKLEKIFIKQGYNQLYLDNLWKEYEDFLHDESLEKYKVKNAVKIFKPYETPNEKLNDDMVGLIFENMGNDEILENIKIILQSGFFADYMSKVKVGGHYPNFRHFEYLAKYLNKEDLQWVINNVDKLDFPRIYDVNLFEYPN